MKAILFIGHGSRDPEGNEQVRTFIDNMRNKIDSSLLVETCFLEFERPSMGEGISACVEKGASHVYVIPIMLLPAGHSKIHIPVAIDDAKATYPNVQFTYGRPIGIHEETIEICKNRLHEIGVDIEQGKDDTAIVLLGRGGSDPDANSDLYKITRLLWEQLPYNIIEPAFMGVTAPLIDESVERCIKLGAKKVVILPYFLFTGILIKRLENVVETYRKKYEDVEFGLANYFGFHPRLETILLDRVNEALEGEVKMNCDTCQYRLGIMDKIEHHHHHDHHHHDHHHENERVHEGK